MSLWWMASTPIITWCRILSASGSGNTLCGNLAWYWSKFPKSQYSITMKWYPQSELFDSKTWKGTFQSNYVRVAEAAHGVDFLRNIALEVWVLAAFLQRYTLYGIEVECCVKFRSQHNMSETALPNLPHRLEVTFLKNFTALLFWIFSIHIGYKLAVVIL